MSALKPFSAFDALGPSDAYQSDPAPLYVLDESDIESPLYVLNESDEQVPLLVLS